MKMPRIPSRRGRPLHYVLDANHQPVPCSMLEWAKMFERNRHVARTEIGEGIVVSTVFLGLDHNHGPDGPPILFETMVFGGSLDDGQLRWATWTEALVGHRRVVERVRKQASLVENLMRSGDET